MILPLGEYTSANYDARVKEVRFVFFSQNTQLLILIITFIYSDTGYGYYWIPMCWTALFVEIFTAASCLAFEKQRKFPTSFGMYMCFIDLIHIIRELVKGLYLAYISFH